MKNLWVLVLALCLIGPAAAHADGKFIVGTTNNGQFTDLQITGANSTTTKKSGLKATIDLASLAQTSAAATTTPVVALSQSATTAPMLGLTCTTGGSTGNDVSCGSYTTTTGAKAGTIKIFINGAARYIDFKSAPN